jgi:hypothetical protein
MVERGPFVRPQASDGEAADSEEKHEPVSDIDTAAVDSLKALDPERPIREADKRACGWNVRYVPLATNAPQQTAALFDHVISAGEQGRRHREAKRGFAS